MCGVWVALEDIHPDAGPLEFYPGSHRLKNIDGIDVGQHPLHNPTAQPDSFNGNATQISVQQLWEERLRASELAPSKFLARKGQALIWVHNLLHGGAARTDIERTRWSQVTHYYFEGCNYYTPLLSKYAIGNIHFRDDVRDIRSGQLMSMLPDPVLPGDFDPDCYLSLHADVKAAGVDAEWHWLNHGFLENRRYK